MTELEQSANGFLLSSKSQWKQLVKIVRETKPRDLDRAARALASGAGVGKPTLLRKMNAINAQMAQGKSDEEIILMGQERVVGALIKAKKAERYEEQVRICWMVSPELKQAITEEFWRIGKVLGIRTQEHLWTYLVSQMCQWTEIELLHSAGMLHGKEKNKSVESR